MNWLDFGRDLPKVKGQWTWSKYAIFTSLPQNLKNPWVDFHQTWHKGTPWGVDEPLGGFSSNLAQGNWLDFGRDLQNPRSKVKSQWTKMSTTTKFTCSSKNVQWCWTLVGIFVLRWRDERSKINDLGLKMLKALSRNVYLHSSHVWLSFWWMLVSYDVLILISKW